MKNIIYSLILVSFSLTVSALTFEGIAKDRKGKAQYIENHVTTIKDGVTVKIITTYLEPGTRKEFARLESDFSKNPFVPDMFYEDKRNRYRVDAKVDGDKVVLMKTETKRGQKRTRKREINIKSNLMMSQGYHNFIVQNMDTFKPGQEIPIIFLAANRMEAFDFKVTYQGPESKGSNRVKFKLEIDNWFIGMFAPELKVTYDKKTKRILAFDGVTNVLDEDGEVQDLVIEFTY